MEPSPMNRAPLAGLLLFIATCLHIAAIIFPFVEMRALLSTTSYGLIPSVVMLMDYGMPVLAVLVVIFSIIFPFAKLAVLWTAWGIKTPGPILGWLVHKAENLGKWSMLDIFLVLLLLAVTFDQTLVATKPLIGMPCFLGGVLCSMSAGVLLAGRWPRAQAHYLQNSLRTWICMGIAGACLLAAQIVPLLRTDSILVTNQDFSIIDIALAMSDSQKWGLAGAIWVGLIVMPWLTWCLYGLALITGKSTHLAHDSARWAMLDVFALALAIFIIESANAVPAIMAPGAIALFLGVFMRPFLIRICLRTQE